MRCLCENTVFGSQPEDSGKSNLADDHGSFSFEVCRLNSANMPRVEVTQLTPVWDAGNSECGTSTVSGCDFTDWNIPVLLSVAS